MVTNWGWFRQTINGVLIGCLSLAASGVASATAPGFVKSTIPLNAPPVGLAFDADGMLYALEGAPFGSNQATLRTILADGTYGNSFTVVGQDSGNFFVGSMAYDPLANRVLISDNTADGRLYAVDNAGVQHTVAMGIAGIAGVAVRHTGEIFVSTSPFGSAGEVFLIDRTDGSTVSVLGGLGYGAGLAFDLAGDLIVQDADSNSFRGRLQRLPISDGPAGLEFGSPVPIISDMQSGAGLTVDSEGDIFTTGSGGLFRVTSAPPAESPFDNIGNAFQFATAIAFDSGSQPFEGFAGPSGGRLAYLADFGFASQDTFVTLLTPARPGDYDTDGDVDDADYAMWRRGFGSTTQLAADGNGNSKVEAGDYVIWRKNVVTSAASSPATQRLNAPEPATIMPLLITIALTLVRFSGGSRGRRRQDRSAAKPSNKHDGLNQVMRSNKHREYSGERHLGERKRGRKE